MARQTPQGFICCLQTPLTGMSQAMRDNALSGRAQWSAQEGNPGRDRTFLGWEKKITAKLGRGLQILAQHQQTL